MVLVLVVLSGYAGSGKDAVASVLCAEQGFTRVAFADKVREVALACSPELTMLVRSVGWDNAKRRQDVRRTLQRLAMAIRDNVDEDAWLDAALRDVDTMFDDIVITDLRFPNELQRVRDLGGTVWRVERAGNGPVNGHESETAVTAADCDLTVRNDGTLADLQSRVLSLI